MQEQIILSMMATMERIHFPTFRHADFVLNAGIVPSAPLATLYLTVTEGAAAVFAAASADDVERW